VLNLKKFEESVFSDLRNLKPGRDASLEEPKVRDSIILLERLTRFRAHFSICSSSLAAFGHRRSKRFSTGTLHESAGVDPKVQRTP
jgi:hypothetical protein